MAAGSRAGHDAWLHRRERERLKHAFAGYVSPNVLDLILRGELDTRIGSGRRMLCVLFADIRNFTAMSEQAEPEEPQTEDAALEQGGHWVHGREPDWTIRIIMDSRGVYGVAAAGRPFVGPGLNSN